MKTYKVKGIYMTGLWTETPDGRWEEQHAIKLENLVVILVTFGQPDQYFEHWSLAYRAAKAMGAKHWHLATTHMYDIYKDGVTIEYTGPLVLGSQ